MRGAALVLFGLVFVSACRCGSPVNHLDEAALQVGPAKLEFPPTHVGYARSLSVEVTNPNRFSVDAKTALTGPFSFAAAPTAFEGGAQVTLAVVFAPTAVGPATGLLSLNRATVALSGDADAPPSCVAATCRSSSNDPITGDCVEAPLADGADCTNSFSCFVQASCQHGDCVGTLTTCADQNPCTLDVCGETGCGHLDGLAACPEPDDPCLVPTCDPATGCGIAPAVDGTPCGPRTCTEASVCINGSCQQRPAPQNQACLDVLAGVPAGQGTSDGVAAFARFRQPFAPAYDDRGNLYVFDSCAVKKISPTGLTRTLAGVPDDCRYLDGAGLAARFEGVNGMIFDGTGLIVADGCQLRRVSLGGLVTSWVGQKRCGRVDGIGAAAMLGYVTLALSPGTRRVVLLDVLNGAMQTTRLIREVSLTTGEVKTIATLSLRPPAPPNNVIDLLPSLAVGADGGVFTCVYEWQLVDNSNVGPQIDWLVRLDRDGGTQDVSEGECLSIAAAADGILISEGHLVTRYDGTARVPVAGTEFGYLDGPVATAKLGFVYGLAVNDGGAAAIDVQHFNIRRIEGGQVTTLAGPRPNRQLIDGPGPASRIDTPSCLASTPDGGVLFFDYTTLRSIDAAGVVSTLFRATRGPAPVDGPWSSAEMTGPSSLAVSGDSAFLIEQYTRPDFTQRAVVQKLDFAAQTVSGVAEAFPVLLSELAINPSGQIAMGLDGRLGLVSSAGVLSNLTPQNYTYDFSHLASDGANGWYGANFGALHHVDGLGVVTLIAGTTAFGVPRDGPVATARFGSLSGIASDLVGNAWLVDRNLVRKYAPSKGTITTVFELSDAPTGIAVEASGTLLVMVPNAILRLHPPP